MAHVKGLEKDWHNNNSCFLLNHMQSPRSLLPLLSHCWGHQWPWFQSLDFGAVCCTFSENFPGNTGFAHCWGPGWFLILCPQLVKCLQWEKWFMSPCLSSLSCGPWGPFPAGWANPNQEASALGTPEPPEKGSGILPWLLWASCLLCLSFSNPSASGTPHLLSL